MWNHGLSRSKCWFQLNRQLLLGLVSLLKGLLTTIVTAIFCSTSHTRTTNFPLVPKSMTFSDVKDLFF